MNYGTRHYYYLDSTDQNFRPRDEIKFPRLQREQATEAARNRV